MNSSINYSGFVDLLENFISETEAAADQTEEGGPEPALEPSVKQTSGDLS